MGSIESRNSQFVEQPDSHVEVEGSYRVHYEGGIHSLGNGRLELKERIDRGNLASFTWNREVGQRISSYQPLLLAIDSRIPNPDLQKEGVNLSPEGKREVWISLPDFPENINQSGSLIVMRGDSCMIRGNLVEGVDEPVEKTIDGFGRLFFDTEKSQIKENLKEEGLVTARMLVGTAAAVITMNKIMAEKSEIDKGSRYISRRNFLKLTRNSLVATGSGYILARTAPYVGALVPHTDIEGYFERIANIVGQYFPENTWMDGRTAVVTAKTIDALKQKTVPEGSDASIIMGLLHNYNARDYLTNANERRKSIQSYAEMMFDQMDEVVSIFPKISKEEARKSLVEYIASMDLVSVTDPKVRLTDQPYRVLDDHIKYLRTIYSPEILDALEKYR